MKLADLVLSNFSLLYVFPRFGIKLGFGEATVQQICQQNNISTPLFLLVCNVYTHSEYLPEKKTLTEIPLDDLTAYLTNSHKDYLEIRIPQIINELLSITENRHRNMFDKFCEKYIADVVEHFNYEEKLVFPYISSLLSGEKSKNYSIEEFEKNHSDIEESLTDLKNIIIKYLPPDAGAHESQNILVDLFLLENDLNKHTLLENKILVSLVERIEKNIK
ncbi:MAG: hemerythrin domain-containing protein [Bacteroidales bacterium]|nr:hemerythrin domain-containing protein [Bacteroidales bacterium]